MIGNLYLAGQITDNIKNKKQKQNTKKTKKETYYIYDQANGGKERNLLTKKKFRVSPGFIAHADYAISCSNYYTS